MSWVSDLLGLSEDKDNLSGRKSEERFPADTYGPAYPIVIHRSEVEDLFRLLEIEENAPDTLENTPLLNRSDLESAIENAMGDTSDKSLSPEKRREEIREILELWKDQLSGDQDAVWATVGTDFRFDMFIARCDARADSEYDAFEKSDELETAREVLERIKIAQDTDSKLALTHKKHLPLEEPNDGSADSN
jgi:hypothetical protein